ncbi:MAG: methyltransferase domain-containing protein [Candidatus Rokubacteria bacterium]|nr:methyltransferase domain-containing protein [Candidatus Rokubacteria bacterium]
MTTGKDREARERDHFDRLAAAHGEIWWGSTTPAGIERLRRRARRVREELARFADPVVLELGSGTGGFTKYVLEELPSLRLVGCDISPEAVRVARERYGSRPNTRFEVADVTRLPWPASTFDAVVGNAVLHHLPIPAALEQCLRVLRPGGCLWFSEPNMLNPQIAAEKNLRVIGRWLQNTPDETAFFRWRLAGTLRAVGFEAVSVEPWDFLHPLVPRGLIGLVDAVGRAAERVPVAREIAGSLMIRALKAGGATRT